MKRIVLTEAQRKTIKRTTGKENWFHSYTQPDFAVCANHIDRQWRQVFKDGSAKVMK